MRKGKKIMYGRKEVNGKKVKVMGLKGNKV